MINHKELRIETNGHLLQTECVTVGNLYGWTEEQVEAMKRKLCNKGLSHRDEHIVANMVRSNRRRVNDA